MTGLLVDNGLLQMRKEPIVPQFKVLFWNLSGGLRYPWTASSQDSWPSGRGLNLKPPNKKQDYYPLNADIHCHENETCPRQRAIYSTVTVHSHTSLESSEIWNFYCIQFWRCVCIIICNSIQRIPQTPYSSPCAPDEDRSRDVTIILVKFWAGLNCKM
jgi:hypothetical protein